MAKTFGNIRVRHVDANDSDALILTFTDRRTFDETRREIMRDNSLKIVDDYFGYQVFTSASEAMKSVRVFCRKPIGA